MVLVLLAYDVNRTQVACELCYICAERRMLIANNNNTTALLHCTTPQTHSISVQSPMSQPWHAWQLSKLSFATASALPTADTIPKHCPHDHIAEKAVNCQALQFEDEASTSLALSNGPGSWKLEAATVSGCNPMDTFRDYEPSMITPSDNACGLQNSHLHV